MTAFIMKAHPGLGFWFSIPPGPSCVVRGGCLYLSGPQGPSLGEAVGLLILKVQPASALLQVGQNLHKRPFMSNFIWCNH